ncbi:NTP transferase domain-containing protein [Streptomyces sp. NPDC048416]|uniref:nucleotidyltransferase family protein n=1 Tax=Streptomyces sp. NPDC048416 TaxID=3365546 RepID=UPI003716C7A4
MTNAAQVTGLLLAAGGGRRLGGRPKALLTHRGRPLVEHAVRMLREGGCPTVYVVLGASADDVRARADLAGCVLIDNPDWSDGMGSSLRAGLDALTRAAAEQGGNERAAPARAAAGQAGGARAALVSLVDQPGIGSRAIARVLAAHRSADSLVAASYDGRRGHPVLFGAARWADIAATATGDRGARAYLKAHEDEIELVECGDVAEPYDIDTEADLGRLQ